MQLPFKRITTTVIHVQYCDIITVLHNRHHKVSQSDPFFMHCQTVTILLRIRVRGSWGSLLDNPPYSDGHDWTQLKSKPALIRHAIHRNFAQLKVQNLDMEAWDGSENQREAKSSQKKLSTVPSGQRHFSFSGLRLESTDPLATERWMILEEVNRYMASF